MSKPKYTFEDFVRDARAVHGDTYDYSQGVYLAKDKDIKIICPIHGPFMQRVRYHLEGHGCPHKDCRQKKREATNLKKYGAANPMQVDVFREKHDETCIEKYGAATPLANQEVREKIISTLEERYGGRSAMCSEEVRAKNRKVPVKVKVAVSIKPERVNANKPDFSVIGTRNDLYILLVNTFGIQDIVRDYQGFAFYVKSRGMYIDTGDCSDNADKARQGNLDYICFRDAELRDAAVWFALECPDGHDYDGQYTWMPKREIIGYTPKCSLTATPDSLSRWAKHYQFQEFYKRELAMWEANHNYHGLPLQMYLYHNRLKYTGKRPSELSDIEIMRGFKIAGILQGYSVFNISLMDQVVSKYNIKSVYDPCAGWGERMLTCAASGIGYLGVDINKALFAGYDEMISRYGLKNARVVNADSACFDATGLGHECVFTCPPYNNREIYTDAGAENLDFDKFLDWWDRVVDMSVGDETRVFAYQIDQAHKSAMNDVLAGRGWRLVRQIPVGVGKVSHMNRAQGVTSKKNFEEVQVFERAWRPGKARRPVRIIGRAFLPYGIRSWNPSTIYL